MRAIRRITKPTLEVLTVLLTADHDLHGFAVAKAANRPVGSAYNVLDRLYEAGLVERYWEEENPVSGWPRRRLYRLTPDGRQWATETVAQRQGFLYRRRSPAVAPTEA